MGKSTGERFDLFCGDAVVCVLVRELWYSTVVQLYIPWMLANTFSCITNINAVSLIYSLCKLQINKLSRIDCLYYLCHGTCQIPVPYTFTVTVDSLTHR